MENGFLHILCLDNINIKFDCRAASRRQLEMELLKTRFLASHYGYFFPEGSNIPITSKGRVDADTFLIFIINEGTEQIDNYTIYNMVQHVPLEMRSTYAKRIGAVEHLCSSIKPKYPKLSMPQGSTVPIEERLALALDYYKKCEDNICECNQFVLAAFENVKCSGLTTIPMDLTDEEREAIIMYINPNEKTFRKNTLLALKVLNRFAKEQEIRFEDAVTVFTEHLG